MRHSRAVSFAEQINDEHLYDPRDVQRFNDADEYATMFIQHGQLGATFDEQRALHVWNASLTWRKEQRVYGRVSQRSVRVNIHLLVYRHFSPRVSCQLF